MAPGARTLRRTAVAISIASFAAFLVALVLDVLALVQQTPHAEESDSAASELAFLLAGLSLAVVGLLITSRLPGNAIGWLVASVGLMLNWLDSSYGVMGRVAGNDPAEVPDAVVGLALTNCLWVPTVGLMSTFVLLLFPDGHLPSVRWRWLAWTSAGVISLLTLAVLIDPRTFDTTPLEGVANPIRVDLPPGWTVLEGVLLALFPVCMLASAWAAVRRFRRASGTERLQLKWLVTAGTFFAAFFGSMLLAGLVPEVRDNTALLTAIQLALPLAFCAIPVAIGVAVLRYRLYEIDVVINKAVVLGALAVFITTVYVAIVVGVGRLVGGGDEPSLALSVVATAVVAVAFQPVRERVQRVANRLVYGQRETPYDVLSAFVGRVGGSYEAVDLLPTMARTVAQGVGAARAEVWLATGPGLVLEATWTATSEAAATGPTTARQLSELPGDRVLPVRHHGDLLGALVVVKPPGEAVTPTEERLLEDVAGQAGLVLRNVRLIEDLRTSRERLVTTQDRERRRLERNLHDGAQQRLVSVALMIHTAMARLDAEADAPARVALEQAAERLRVAIEELRELARGIHPAILTERGLGPAIRSLAERSPVPVVVDYRLAERPPAAVEATVYFLVAEALTNVAKYAGATQVEVAVHEGDDSLHVQISDDGVGGADMAHGSGLRGLADRVSVVAGVLAVHSPPGGGTRLTCTIPVRSGPDPAQTTAVVPAALTLEAAR